jgi:hypothetical protein
MSAQLPQLLSVPNVCNNMLRCSRRGYGVIVIDCTYGIIPSCASRSIRSHPSRPLDCRGRVGLDREVVKERGSERGSVRKRDRSD